MSGLASIALAASISSSVSFGGSSGAAGAPRGGKARLGALPDQAALEFGQRAKHMNPFPPPDADLRSARPHRVSLPVAGRNDRRRDDRRAPNFRSCPGKCLRRSSSKTEIQLKFEVWKHL